MKSVNGYSLSATVRITGHNFFSPVIVAERPGYRHQITISPQNLIALTEEDAIRIAEREIERIDYVDEHSIGHASSEAIG